MKHRWLSRTFPLARLLSVALLLVATAATARAPLPSSFRSCPAEELHRTAQCGTVAVPEDIRHPTGPSLALYVVVLPATGDAPARPDPILFLSGGPGQAATESVADIGGSLAGLNRERDLVFIDQRGTGKSSPLNCSLMSGDDPAAVLHDSFPPAAVERCAAALKGQADVAHYSMRHFADDLEAVRQALGYGPVNLYGLSFGTRASQVYMRDYPKSVRTAYLGSIVPIDIATPLPFAKAAQAVLDRTFDACGAEPKCANAFPKLREEFAAVLARLDEGVSVSVPGTTETAALHRGRVAEYLRYLLYKTDSAAGVPSLIHHAYRGDWKPLVDGLLAVAREVDAHSSTGLFFTITCNEDVAFIDERDIAQTQGTFLGDFRVRNQQAACARWPHYTVSKSYRLPLRTDVPTLIVSGDLDPATPISFATHAAPGFSHRAELVLRGQGHTGWSDCAERAYTELVQSGSVKRIATDCPSTPWPTFSTD